MLSEVLMVMKFMLCLDGSKLSESAIPICKSLAEATQAQVEVVRVIEHEPVNTGEAYSGNITLPPGISKHLEDEDRRLLKHLDEIATTLSTPTTTRLLHGADTAKVLVEEATMNGVDMVIMATHSRGSVGEAIFGSVAQEVTKSGVAPVLLVHPVHSPVPTRLPVGAYVFTSDGQDLGKLLEVTARQIKVEDDTGHDLWLDSSDVATIEAGRILLHYDASDLPRHLVPAG